MGEFRVAFISSDYEAAVGFFTDTLGLEVLRSFEEGGRGTIVVAGSGQIEIFAPDVGWGEPGVTGATLAWEVDDAEADYRRLREAGAVIADGPSLKPWGHRSFVVEGPDGWSITLYEIVVPQ